jgi:hypothetical protein
MDHLYDIQVLLPAIFERGVRLEAFPQSLGRRLKAKDLLDNCYRIDRMFENWYTALREQYDMPLYWTVPEDSSSSGSFSDSEFQSRFGLPIMDGIQYEFIDINVAFLHLCYWSALCLFYRAVQHIHKICWEPIPSPRMSPKASSSHFAYTQQQPLPMMNSAQTPPSFYQPTPMLQQTFPQAWPIVSLPAEVSPIINPFSNGMYPYDANPVPNFDPQQGCMYDSIPREELGVPSFVVTITPEPSSEFTFPPLTHDSSPTSSSSYHSTSRCATPTASNPSPAPYMNGIPPVPRNSPFGPALTSNTPTPSFLPPLDPKFSEESINGFASNICYALPHTLCQVLNHSGPDQSVWPLWNAMQVFRRQGKINQHQWCVASMEGLRREGWGFARRVSAGSWKEWDG